MFNSKYSKFLTVLLVIAIIAIVVLLGFFGYDLYTKHFVNKNAQEAIAQFEKATEDNNKNNNNNNSGELEQAGNTVLSSGTQTTKLEGYAVMGTIEIPKIDVKYPILENVTKKSIEIAVAVLYGPGLNQVGNTVIVGHNYRNGTMFSNLSKLSNGDSIYITDTTGQKVKYSIYNMYQTTAEDFEYATRDTGGKREISLSTCVTNDSAHRTIIWARED